MKPLLLLALRLTTGALLIVWGTIKVMEPARAIRVSEGLYGGALSAEVLQTPLGAAEIALGALVALGLFRRVVYPLHALVLIAGALALWKYILDPLGAWLLTPETRQYLFFPSSTVAVASLLLIAFMAEDRIALDRLLFRKR
jgi:uncharacterized membrane protein YphA (DoxX/SURF4 family)